MIRPTKHMKLEQCTLSVAALLLQEIKQLLVIPLVQLDDLVSLRLGDAALANLQNALNLLYLIGLIEYDDSSDVIFCVEADNRGCA